ncbi:hypothetical protein [Haliangium ochraceum]|nr:hypothetical protein [Haliangium ochraceum]
MRVFKKGYYHFFKAVAGGPELTTLASGLRRRAIAEANATLGRTTNKKAPARSFAEQLAIFQALFAEGFEGKEWQKKQRGAGRKRLKRHRDAAIADAQKLLAKDALEPMLAEERYSDVIDAAVKVLAATDLTTKKQLEGLQKIPSTRTENVACALVNLLHGEDDYELRFERWLRALLAANGDVNWTLTTALPALMSPEQHICIRPSVFRRQAETSSRSDRWPSTPSALRYARLLTIARELVEALQSAGQAPRDLLDIYDFIYITRRPSAGKVLQKAAEEREAEEAKKQAEQAESADSDSDAEEERAAA